MATAVAVRTAPATRTVRRLCSPCRLRRRGLVLFVPGWPGWPVWLSAGVLGEEHAELVMVSGAHPGALTQLHALLCPVLASEFPAAWLGGRR
jgi:hypothetical protein